MSSSGFGSPDSHKTHPYMDRNGRYVYMYIYRYIYICIAYVCMQPVCVYYMYVGVSIYKLVESLRELLNMLFFNILMQCVLYVHVFHL